MGLERKQNPKFDWNERKMKESWKITNKFALKVNNNQWPLKLKIFALKIFNS